ncbi:MAG: hypothetical protein M3N35_06570 [Candidatus Binatota bacterium]|nr:hypothetical protein [Candidatus Binatota bacterium]
MNEISKYVPITKAKNDLLEPISQVENVDESIAVTKYGVPYWGNLKHGETCRFARDTRYSQRRS